MANVFSFVADVPFENPTSSFKSTLTHVLPLVSKDVHRITSTDYYWKDALDRLTIKDPYLWQKGLLSFLPKGMQPPSESESSSSLAQQVAVHLNTTSFRHLFRRLTSEYLRFTAPIFHMQGQVRLGHAFGLHFFEPRYRLLIRTVMEEYRNQHHNDNDNTTTNSDIVLVDGPSFIYAHQAPLAPTSVACIVQVRQCQVYGDGSADVTLVPTHYVWLERVRELPSTGRLYQGRCLKMGGDATQRMEQRDNVDVMQFILRQEHLHLLHGGGGPFNISTRVGAMHAILRYLTTGDGEELVVNNAHYDSDLVDHDDNDDDDDDDNDGGNYDTTSGDEVDNEE